MTIPTSNEILSGLAVLIGSSPLWCLLVLASAVALIRRKAGR